MLRNGSGFTPIHARCMPTPAAGCFSSICALKRTLVDTYTCLPKRTVIFLILSHQTIFETKLMIIILRACPASDLIGQKG